MSGVEDTVVESPKKTGRVKYFVSVGVLALVAVIACVYLFVVAPHNRAVKAFEVAAAQVRRRTVRCKLRLMLLSSRSIRETNPLMLRRRTR